ncbi:MAG: hypothetical protein KDD42_10080 [Bdellovibrionales bacterium]|nr:hypothetical protein [Bdellovibrionales bacterium]
MPLFACLCILGCATSTRFNHALIGRLSNRGPIALSSSNPYLAANLLLAKEIERSPELKGFISYRGAPQALEIRSEALAPLNMYLYYPEQRERYLLEEADESWFIAMPEKIPTDELKAIVQLTRNVSDNPKLLTSDDSEPESIKARAPTQDTRRRQALAQTPFSSPADGGLGTQADKAAKIRPADTTPQFVHRKQIRDAGNVEEARLKEIIKKSPSHSAEVTSKGDLVHYVTYEGESLSMIARWYTLDGKNAARLGRINELADPNQLSLGDTIIVPSYLVRNTKRLSEKGLRELASLREDAHSER